MRKPEHTPKNRDTRLACEKGNVLLIIFISIALLAGLTFTFTRTGGDSSNVLTSQQDGIAADEIFSYSNKVEEAVQRMMTQGTPESELSFEGTPGATYTNAAAGNEDKLYNSVGGGLTYAAPKTAWLDAAWNAEPRYGVWAFTGANSITGVGTTDATAASADLVLLLPWIKKSLCLRINDKLGITNPSGDAPQDTASYAYSPFTGAFATGDITDAGSYLNGKTSGCFKATNVAGVAKTNSYHYYRVVLAR